VRTSASSSVASARSVRGNQRLHAARVVDEHLEVVMMSEHVLQALELPIRAVLRERRSSRFTSIA
jgi:hypothetical protein